MHDLTDVIGSQEAADLLQITTQHVKRLIERGDLTAKKISAGYVLLKSDVLALKKQRRKKHSLLQS